MKKLVLIATIAIVLVGLTILGISCQKEVNKPDIPEIIMSYQKTTEGGQVITERQAVTDGQVVFLPDSTLTCAFWTDPLTPVNWVLSGPQSNDWDQELIDQVSVQFMYTGTYTLSISTFAVDWSITIIIGGSPTASQVNARFVSSIFDGILFHYTFRINRPSYVLDGDQLFRITEDGDDYQAPYTPYFNGVSFFGSDSIDITFAYPPSGNTALNIKFIAGRIEGVNPIWFTADPNSPYKCDDAPPLENDIFQVNLKNGLVLPPDQNFAIPAGVSPGMADYGESIPIVLAKVTPTSGIIHFWVFTSSNNPIFRYKVTEGGVFSEIALTSAGGGYWYANLPIAPPNGYYTFDFGSGTGLEFVQDQLVSNSSLYYTPINALRLYL